MAGKLDGVGEGATGSRNTSGSETCVRNFNFMWVSRFAFLGRYNRIVVANETTQ